ncbi:MAG: hypothetical protein MUC93_06070 [Bacteroidales bacterium]|jgi:selenocysteine lyase/cysteine desulfurase|nr:hypothetical protein [Bacteroidales bacterium]
MHKIRVTDNSSAESGAKPSPGNNDIAVAFTELGRGVHASLETYSNVHRGSGHNSMVSTYLFEQAREIVLEYLGLNRSRYVVIFCTPGRAEALQAQLKPGSYQIVSSQEIGLPLGVRALAVKRKNLPGGPPSQAGGGTTRLVADHRGHSIYPVTRFEFCNSVTGFPDYSGKIRSEDARELRAAH